MRIDSSDYNAAIRSIAEKDLIYGRGLDMTESEFPETSARDTKALVITAYVLSAISIIALLTQ